VIVIIFGATGMVGKGVLLECLDDPRVARVVSIGRQPLDMSHPKLHNIVHTDFFNYEAIQPEFAGADACFFCLGVTSVGKSEAEYTRLTYDLTLAAGNAIAAAAIGGSRSATCQARGPTARSRAKACGRA